MIKLSLNETIQHALSPSLVSTILSLTCLFSHSFPFSSTSPSFLFMICLFIFRLLVISHPTFWYEILKYKLFCLNLSLLRNKLGLVALQYCGYNSSIFISGEICCSQLFLFLPKIKIKKIKHIRVHEWKVDLPNREFNQSWFGESWCIVINELITQIFFLLLIRNLIAYIIFLVSLAQCCVIIKT